MGETSIFIIRQYFGTSATHDMLIIILSIWSKESGIVTIPSYGHSFVCSSWLSFLIFSPMNANIDLISGMQVYDNSLQTEFMFHSTRLIFSRIMLLELRIFHESSFSDFQLWMQIWS